MSCVVTFSRKAQRNLTQSNLTRLKLSTNRPVAVRVALLGYAFSRHFDLPSLRTVATLALVESTANGPEVLESEVIEEYDLGDLGAGIDQGKVVRKGPLDPASDSEASDYSLLAGGRSAQASSMSTISLDLHPHGTHGHISWRRARPGVHVGVERQVGRRAQGRDEGGAAEASGDTVGLRQL